MLAIEYFKLHKYYEEKYGPNICLLCQVGKFYEMYQYIPSLNNQEVQTDQKSENFAHRLSLKKLSCATLTPDSSDTPQPIITSMILNTHLIYKKKNRSYSMETFQNSFPYPLDSNQSIGKATEISMILNMHLINRNKNKPHSIENPLMMGFPYLVYENHRDIILTHGYTIIRIDQINKNANDEDVEREVVEISSSGTEIDNNIISHNTASNCIVAIYLECQKSRRNPENNTIVCGLSCVDVSTSRNMVSEVYSKENDEIYAMQEIYRFLTTQQPVEIIIYVNKLPKDEIGTYNKYLYDTLELDKYPVRTIRYNLEPDFQKLAYHEEFLRKIFMTKNKIHNNILQPNTFSIIDELNLELFHYGRISYIILLQYCYEHNEILLQQLSKPIVHWTDQNDHIIMTYNAINQLDILAKNTHKYNSHHQGFDSLISVVDMTSTQIGSRFLRRQILNPITDASQLNKYYDMTDELINNKPLLDCIHLNLQRIPDIERLQRKIQLNIIKPREFILLFNSYKSITNLVNIIGDNKIFSILPNKEDITEFYGCVDEVNNIIDFDQLEDVKYFIAIGGKCRRIHVNKSFVKPGIDENIDLYQYNLHQCLNWLYQVCDHLNTFITNVRGKKIEPSFDRSNKNRQEGDNDDETEFSVGLYTTNSRASSLKNANINTQLCGTIEFIHMKSKVFITSSLLRQCYQSIEHYQLTMEKLLLEKFYSLVNEISHKQYFRSLNNFVAHLDFITSNALTARKYHYYRPIIDLEFPSSYIDIKEMRHPLIERIIKSEYIVNDISIGKNHRGVLLFGINSTGKCLAPDTLVIKFTGHPVRAQEIKTGDLLMGDDSQPRKVLSTIEGIDNMYEIIPRTGDSFQCTGDHILVLKSSGDTSIIWDQQNWEWKASYITKGQIISKSFRVQNNYNRLARFPKCLIKNQKTDGFHPPDGCVSILRAGTCSGKENIMDEYGNEKEAEIAARKFIDESPSDTGNIINISVIEYMKKPQFWRENYHLYSMGVEFSNKKVCIDPYLLGFWLGGGVSTQLPIPIDVNFVPDILQKYDLFNDKHIPDDYKFNNQQVRKALLAGLIDANGWEIVPVNKRLADDIIYLGRSLGYLVNILEDQPCRLIISGDNLDGLPLILKRKNLPSDHEKPNRSFKIRHLGRQRYYGFALDGNHRFLLGDFTVSHNSSLAKALGISVIMAQSGMYVAGRMTYKPFTKIITRLSGHDDLLKGQSSFIVEMSELRTILRNADADTLILGDELCRGTESIAGTSLMVATLETLIQRKCTFIFSTHMHHLPEMEIIKKMQESRSILIAHLSATYDEKLGFLVYNRKLQEGSGSSSYGIDVCKSLAIDRDFIDRANEIRRTIENKGDKILNTKKSSYSRKIYIDRCAICGNTLNLHTHHIEEQHKADDKGYIKHYHKNIPFNLLVLCDKCHKWIHANGNNIVKKETLNGVYLKIEK